MQLRLALFIMAVTLIGGCITLSEPSGDPPLSPLEEKGWKVFQREPCFSACHVTTVALPVPDDSAGFVPDLRKTPRRTPDWYLAYFINPRAVLPYSSMPSFAQLSSDELKALIAFLQWLNRKVTPPNPEAAASEEIPRILKDFATYKAGQAVYSTYCVGCHGVAGSGGGSVGHLLSPEPRDFTDAVWMSKQTENYLFSIITEGKPDTAMPGFKEILTPAERALVLRYIEYFADPVSKQRIEVGLVGQSSQE